MSYYFAKTIEMPFADAIEHVTSELAKEGFGVLADIDVKATLKKKLDADFRDYRILGACSPQHALRALEAEDKIGVLLPCSVAVQDAGDGKVEVAAMNPIVAMQAVGNTALLGVGTEVAAKLRKVVDGL